VFSLLRKLLNLFCSQVEAIQPSWALGDVLFCGLLMFVLFQTRKTGTALSLAQIVLLVPDSLISDYGAVLLLTRCLAKGVVIIWR